jgi:hypothetical protein
MSDMPNHNMIQDAASDSRKAWHEPEFRSLGQAEGGNDASGNEASFPSQPNYLPS